MLRVRVLTNHSWRIEAIDFFQARTEVCLALDLQPSWVRGGITKWGCDAPDVAGLQQSPSTPRGLALARQRVACSRPGYAALRMTRAKKRSSTCRAVKTITCSSAFITPGYQHRLKEFWPSRMTHFHLLKPDPSTCLFYVIFSRDWDHGTDCISNDAAVGWPWDDWHGGLYPLAMMTGVEISDFFSWFSSKGGPYQSVSLLNSSARTC